LMCRGGVGSILMMFDVLIVIYCICVCCCLYIAYCIPVLEAPRPGN
jgi:hypothetical protein